jgi:hypothetical protein
MVMAHSTLPQGTDKFRLLCRFTSGDGRVTRSVGDPLSRELAEAWFDDQVKTLDGDALRYGPHSGNTVHVISDREWRRIKQVQR